MTVFAEGAQAVARLIAANPDLPVYKMGGGYEDDDSFVLELESSRRGDDDRQRRHRDTRPGGIDDCARRGAAWAMRLAFHGLCEVRS